ncbi:hypothetical protein FAY30_01040 [Bacillus sp. S3]|uniref:nitrilase-related carbon-nitrogen hydrolase n=1 Tax=Bacillus sp. S3 TaxID=486398 RepID=UPI00118A36E4|nr:nitrilase-related carbon-nitrogen hydrolase [Bacillus sp. S3]QCJ40611.1 hypothetical protein FAY30_01040 [Bacillus sp. S3]
MRNIRVSLVQFESIIGDVKANYKKAANFIEEAATKQKSDLVVFPELFLSGYDLGKLGKDYFRLAVDEDSAILKDFCDVARAKHINLILPVAFKSKMPGITYNSAVAISREGEIIGVYHKTHLWAGEKNYFISGDEQAVFSFDFGKVGIMICYDGGFPEIARIHALNGAELIVCPSAFPYHDKDLWDIYFLSRSLENACFVAATNLVYHENGHHLYGNNKLVNPRGKLLLEGNLDKEEMQTIEINLDDVAEVRQEVPFLRDRQVHTFKGLV